MPYSRTPRGDGTPTDTIEREEARDNHVLVNEAADLPAPDATTGEHHLDAQTTYEFNGTVHVDHPVRVAEDTTLYGFNWGIDCIHYMGTDAAVKSRGAPVYMRNMCVEAPNGAVFDLQAPSTTPFLIDTIRILSAADLGVIDGFRAHRIRGSFFEDYGEGLRLQGTSDETVLEENLFRNPAEGVSTLTLGDSLLTEFVDMAGCHFRHHPASATALTVEPGATVTELGIVRGNVLPVSSSASTVGVDETTLGWEFLANAGIESSTVAGNMYVSGNTTATTFGAQNAWVKPTIPTSAGELERISHQSPNQLTYEAVRSRRMGLMTTVGMESAANNAQYELAVFVNGTLMPNTVTGVTFRQSGQIASPTVNALRTVEEGQTLDLRVRCTTGTSSCTIRRMSMTVSE